MICPNCGKETAEDATTCPHCGKSISASQEISPQATVSDTPELFLSQLNRNHDILSGCLYLAAALCLLILPFVSISPVLPITMNLIDFTSFFGDGLVSSNVEVLVLTLPWISLLLAAVSGLLCFAKPSSLMLRQMRASVAIAPSLGLFLSFLVIRAQTNTTPQAGLWLALLLSVAAYLASCRNNSLARKALKLLKQQGR